MSSIESPRVLDCVPPGIPLREVNSKTDPAFLSEAGHTYTFADDPHISHQDIYLIFVGLSIINSLFVDIKMTLIKLICNIYDCI